VRPEAPGVGAPLEIVFDRLRSRVREESPGLFSALQALRLSNREPGRLRFEAPNPFNRQRIEDRRDELEAICTRFFGEPTRIEVAEATPAAARSAQPRLEESRRLRQQALNHPLVNTALEVLEADIVEIRPLRAPSPPPPSTRSPE
jgi:DNA polymerase-3 subunit gamma/tau